MYTRASNNTPSHSHIDSYAGLHRPQLGELMAILYIWTTLHQIVLVSTIQPNMETKVNFLEETTLSLHILM